MKNTRKANSTYFFPIPRYVSVGLLLLLIASGIFSGIKIVTTTYNTMVFHQTASEEALANLDTVYQRRYALVENLVTLVKETKAFETYLVEVEREIYPAVAKAKAQATQMSFQVPEETSQRIYREEKFGQLIMGLLDKLLILAQHFPPISDPVVKDRSQTFEAFTKLQYALSSLENDVQDKREYLNSTVRQYNQSLRIFPANLWAASWGFTPLPNFEVLLPTARDDVRITF